MDFRRGLDKFLCRVHSQLCDALSRQNLADLELCLVMLGDYLHFCPTRVMASQVIDVAMETLLHVKVPDYRNINTNTIINNINNKNNKNNTDHINHSSWCSTWCLSPCPKI